MENKISSTMTRREAIIFSLSPHFFSHQYQQMESFFSLTPTITTTTNLPPTPSTFIIIAIGIVGTWHPHVSPFLLNKFGEDNNMLFRKMLGGNFTSAVEGNRSQYDKTASSQLQLVGNVTTQYPAGLVMINYASNDHTPTDTRPNKRVREEEPTLVQQKLQLHKPNRSGLVLNPYPISPGLRLSRDSSSISSTSENPTNASPFARSLTNTVKTEIDQQMEEIGQYIKLQRENILKGGREIKERHTTSLLSALEKGLSKRLHEKDVEIESMNSKNKELEERIKQVSTEAQSWHDKADFNELVANSLSKNFEQMLARGAGDGGCEGFGDSEGDDALSSLKQPGVSVSGECDRVSRRLRCRACKENRVSMLLFPCRHLCLCDGCEGRVGVCPVCRVVKTASFPVNL